VTVTTSRLRTGRIPLEELCRLPSLYHVEPSWRGDQIAFYWDRSGRIELYTMDMATREPRQVSHGEVPRALRSFFVWEREDRALVFAKDHDGDEQHDLYRIDAASGAVTQLTLTARPRSTQLSSVLTTRGSASTRTSDRPTPPTGRRR
jgi:Tol biopolymer transport system component